MYQYDAAENLLCSNLGVMQVELNSAGLASGILHRPLDCAVMGFCELLAVCASLDKNLPLSVLIGLWWLMADVVVGERAKPT